MLDIKNRTILLSERLKLFEAVGKTGNRQSAILKAAKEQIAIDFPDGFVSPYHIQEWVSYLNNIYFGNFEGALFSAEMVRASHQQERYRHLAEEKFTASEKSFIHKELLRVWSIKDPLLRIQESKNFSSLSYEKGVKDGSIVSRDYYIYNHLSEYCKL